jgi:hypothetical protein
MDSVFPVIVATPDGVERTLRFTQGSRRRIVNFFGVDFKAALEKYGDAAVPAAIHAMLHDGKGRLPDGVPETVEEFEQQFPGDVMSSKRYLAAAIEAITQGKVDQKKITELIDQQMSADLRSLITSPSTLSVANGSVLQNATSGGDYSNANSSPESASTEPNSASGTSGAEPSPPA